MDPAAMQQAMQMMQSMDPQQVTFMAENEEGNSPAHNSDSLIFLNVVLFMYLTRCCILHMQYMYVCSHMHKCT